MIHSVADNQQSENDEIIGVHVSGGWDGGGRAGAILYPQKGAEAWEGKGSGRVKY